MIKIYFFLIILSYKSEDSEVITLKARSVTLFKEIKHHFSFYYGNEKNRFRYISCQIDLNYRYTLFTEFHIDKNGLICMKESNCQMSKKSHFIYDNEFRNLITTNPGVMPLYLNPNDLHQNDKEWLISTKIEIKRNNQYYKFKNVVGLNYQSQFLEYLCILYKKEKINISFNFNFKSHFNYQELLDNPNIINYEITFFEEPTLECFYHQSGKSLTINDFAIKGFGLKFEKLKVSIDLESPFLATIPEDIYILIIKKIKAIICNNPYICEKEGDLFSGYDNNLNLNFITPKNTLNELNHVFAFNIDHLFFIDEEKNIKYNFRIKHVSQLTISLGLPFLTKANLYIEYHKSFEENSFHFYLYKKHKYHHYKVISFILLSSFLLSILFSVIVIKISDIFSPTYLINKDISQIYLDSDGDN